MANQEQIALMQQGVEAWNRWRKENPSTAVDLSGAQLSEGKLRGIDLAGANLREAYLSKADLREADLSGADLSDALLNDTICSFGNFSGAGLQNANLWGANLWSSNFRGASLDGAELWRANLRNTNFSGASLSGADLTSALLLETNLANANLSGAIIYGIAAWNVELSGAVQNNLVITQPGEACVMVDDLEVAQFVYLLLNNRKLRNVFNAVAEQGVLILGRFGGGGLEVLHAIAARLRELKYIPILFDFERPANRDYTETVKMLAGLSRFVIVDLSGPSVPQELYATIPFYDIPFVPIIETGRTVYAMFRDFYKYPWVLRPVVEYTSPAHLLEILAEKVVTPAEERHKAKQAETGEG